MAITAICDPGWAAPAGLRSSFCNHVDHDHPTVHLRVGDWEADVDLGVAPLIELLWLFGLETAASCEDLNGTGRVQVTFDLATGAERFLSLLLVGAPRDDDLGARIMAGLDGDVRSGDHWSQHLCWSRDGWRDPHHRGDDRIAYGIAMTFPRRDLAEVVHRLRSALAREAMVARAWDDTLSARS